MKAIKKIPSLELARFTRQLATLIGAGLPLVQSLSVIRHGIEKTPLGQLTQKLSIHLEKGQSFSEALKLFPKQFNAFYYGLIESGEQSGTLDIMLNRLAIHQEKTESLKRKIRKAATYPLAVLIIASSVTILLMLKVVPLFKELFKGSNTPLPAFTELVLSISEMLQSHGWIIILLLCLAIIMVKQLYYNKKHPGFKHWIETHIFKLPIMGSLIHHTILARITRTLATTLSAGVPLTEALNTLTRATQNIVYHRTLIHVQQSLKNGQSLHHSMEGFKTFAPMLIQMVKIGEHSGTLATMLDKLATLYEEKVDVSIDGLTTLLEPLLMVMLGIIVGGLIIAMYLPIFNMGSVF